MKQILITLVSEKTKEQDYALLNKGVPTDAIGGLAIINNTEETLYIKEIETSETE